MQAGSVRIEATAAVNDAIYNDHLGVYGHTVMMQHEDGRLTLGNMQ